jgi:hypothetical protein
MTLLYSAAVRLQVRLVRWMGIEGGIAIGAALVAGLVGLLGFGLDSGIEAMASIILIWRFTYAAAAARL